MLRYSLVFAGVILLSGAVAAIYQSYRNDLRATQTHPPLGKFVTVDGTKVHYYMAGNGPVVILLHGAGGNLRDFTFQLAGKLEKYYTVLAFDRPGHGYTETLNDRGESPQEQAALLHKAARLIGVDKAVVGGYSFGGAVALRWALDYPETTTGLLLMSAVSNPWVKPPSYLYNLSGGRFIGSVFNTLVSAFAPKSLVDDTIGALFAPQDPVKGYLEYIGTGLTMRKSQLAANGRQVLRLLAYVKEQSARYETLTLPVEIIHGGQDTTVPASVHAEVLARQLPQAVYTRMDNLGHDTQHYAHKEILAALKRLTTGL